MARVPTPEVPYHQMSSKPHIYGTDATGLMMLTSILREWGKESFIFGKQIIVTALRKNAFILSLSRDEYKRWEISKNKNSVALDCPVPQN